MSHFTKELERLINRHSQENGSDTPDFILAGFLSNCLDAWNAAVSAREAWYGRPKPDPTGRMSVKVLSVPTREGPIEILTREGP